LKDKKRIFKSSPADLNPDDFKKPRLKSAGRDSPSHTFYRLPSNANPAFARFDFPESNAAIFVFEKICSTASESPNFF